MSDTETLRSLFKKEIQAYPIIPVASVSNSSDALKLAEIYLKFDLNCIEITLRNEGAIEAIQSVVKAFPQMLCGAGSILSVEDCSKAIDAGASFCVSPVFNRQTAQYTSEKLIPYVPGVATPNEFIKALEFSDIIKIFPASSLGGPGYIKSIIPPFKSRSFSLIPTGGISISNFLDYLSIDRVKACGMSYIADSKLISSGDFGLIESRVQEVSDLLQK